MTGSALLDDVDSQVDAIDTSPTSAVAKARGKALARHAAAQGKAVKRTSKATRRDFKARRKASKAAAKASEAAAAEAATRPARVLDRLMDPKLAKRAVALGKIVTPEIAPAMLTTAARTRGFLDRRRARELGVPIDDVAKYRGPTGATTARIDGLTESVRTLAGGISGGQNDAARFAAATAHRLDGLRATTEAAATMPRRYRAEVLRTVGAELDELDRDLVAHLLTPA